MIYEESIAKEVRYFTIITVIRKITVSSCAHRRSLAPFSRAAYASLSNFSFR